MCLSFTLNEGKLFNLGQGVLTNVFVIRKRTFLSVTLLNQRSLWPEEMWTFESGLGKVCSAFVERDE